MKLRIFIIPIITILIATACNFTLDIGLEEELSNQDEPPVPSITAVIPTDTIIQPQPVQKCPPVLLHQRLYPALSWSPWRKWNRHPWLSLDKSAVPIVHYVGFNTTKPPFNNPMVRQAFAYAVDRR